jgi:hypothetical protein
MEFGEIPLKVNKTLPTNKMYLKESYFI